ncbi:MAG: hypothetical protein ABI041_03345, partial [Bdellovibrionia bacterium]
LQVTGTCDEINRTDGSCVDYADVLVFDLANSGIPAEVMKPIAKKRFYLRVLTQEKDGTLSQNRL